MNLPPYKAALKMGKKALNELLIPAKAAKAKKQAELEMCKLDESISSKEVELQDACTSDELNFETIIDIQDRIALLKRRKEQYQKILDEMFPE